MEIQRRQVGEVANLRRDIPGQLVLIEIECCQVREVTQLGRNLPGHAVAREVQIDHPPAVCFVRPNLVQISPESQVGSRRTRVDGDSRPFTERGAARPTVLEPPVCPIRCGVERGKRRPVRRIIPKPGLCRYAPGGSQLPAHSGGNASLDLLRGSDRRCKRLEDEGVVRLIRLPVVDESLPRLHHGRALIVIGQNLFWRNDCLHPRDHLREQLRYLAIRCGDFAVRVRGDGRGEIRPSRRAE